MTAEPVESNFIPRGKALPGGSDFHNKSQMILDKPEIYEPREDQVLRSLAIRVSTGTMTLETFKSLIEELGLQGALERYKLSCH